MFDLPLPSAPTPPVITDHPVYGHPPVGDPYVLGRWHKGRVTPRGYARAGAVWARCAMLPPGPMPRRFLIFGRPRSGSTLLARLLNQVHGVACAGEMLNYAMGHPHRYLNGLARLSGAQVFGSKFLSYQMLEIQRTPDPSAFFADLADDGYTLLHLRRNTFDQALSLSLAQATGHYHRLKGDRKAPPQAQVDIAPDAFADQFAWNAQLLDFEDRLMSGVPHIRVSYEEDLSQARFHQRTIDRICARLGLPPSPVKADMRRIGGPNGIVRARNAKELRLMMGSPALPVRLAG
ncbi:MAG: hypothetical protein AAFQ79_10140 [Pseudomonadota bacterium]